MLSVICFATGCVGAINGLSNILGDEVCKIYRLFQEGDLTSAVPLQQRLAYPNTLVIEFMMKNIVYHFIGVFTVGLSGYLETIMQQDLHELHPAIAC